MTKVAVFGAGSWGTAFSLVLADAGNEVTLWARRQELSDAINSRHENGEYLPGIAAARRPSTPPMTRSMRWTAPRWWSSPCRRSPCARTSSTGRTTSRPTPS